jgi:predicted RecA/RadA family phage recombinase
MTKKYIQPGEVLDYTAGANIASGDVVLVGVRVGVALADIANGATGPVQVSGVFELTKLSTDAPVQGALLYWDNTNKRLTTTASGNTLAGYAFKGAASGLATVQIKLNA